MIMINKQQHRLALQCMFIMLLFQAVIPVSAFARTEPQPKLISITVKRADISELFEMLSRQHNVNILLGNGVQGEVSLNLYNISVDDAIHAIASAADLAVERMGNGYLITQHANVGKTIAGGLTDVRTYKIQYSDIKTLSEIIKKHLSQYGKSDILDDRRLLIVEDKPEFLDRIERLLEKLDKPPAQILIEAKILSITLDDTQKYGVDWTKTFNAAGGEGNFGIENLGKQATDLAIGAAAGPPGLFFNYLNSNVEAQLNLLSQKNKVETLASPSLLAMEHQEAEVIIGARTGYKVTTTINQVTTESIQFLESGVILKVTPYIDQYGRIMMEIHPEVSETTLGGENKDIPSQTTTEVNTRLLVEDGQMIFIGGLIRNNLTNGHQGVPILEDIPILGYLFSADNTFATNTETVVLLKPQIIHSGNINLITTENGRAVLFGEQRRKKAETIENYFKNHVIYQSK